MCGIYREKHVLILESLEKKMFPNQEGSEPAENSAVELNFTSCFQSTKQYHESSTFFDNGVAFGLHDSNGWCL